MSYRSWFCWKYSYLVKIEDKIKLTHIMEKFIQNLHKIMNGLQVCQVVVTYINADTKVQASITAIHNFKVPELQTIICEMLSDLSRL